VDTGTVGGAAGEILGGDEALALVIAGEHIDSTALEIHSSEFG